jgi:hypothetical protein
MKNFAVGGLVLTSMLSAAAPSFAQGINQRATNQQGRINQGVASGALTPGEAARDERHAASIQDQTARMRARDDGHLTNRDRRVLNGRLNHESNRIYRTKHNGRVG